MVLFKPMVELAHDILCKYVLPGDHALDCTAGKGRDTLFLAELVGKDGLVYAFDIQKSALRETEIALSSQGLAKQVSLIQDSHENLDAHVKTKVKAAIFNLGYLPGGRQNIITRSGSTLKALEKTLNVMQEQGVLLVIAYLGHAGGREEYETVKDFFTKLPLAYTSGSVTMLNRKLSPVLLVAEKQNQANQ